jgi:hypothetical protein
VCLSFLKGRRQAPPTAQGTNYSKICVIACPSYRDTQWHKSQWYTLCLALPLKGRGRHCRQAAQETIYINMCVIACPCTRDTQWQSLVIYFVSFVAPEAAEAGAADKHRKTQIMLNIEMCVIVCPLYSQGSFTAAVVQETRNATNLNNILCVFRCPWRGGGKHCRQAGTGDKQRKTQITLKLVSLHVPVQSGITAAIVQGTRNDTNINYIRCVSRCPWRGGGRHRRQAAQDTNYIKMCVIVFFVQSRVTAATVPLKLHVSAQRFPKHQRYDFNGRTSVGLVQQFGMLVKYYDPRTHVS